MLGMKKYESAYIDGCRARVEAAARVFRKQAGTSPAPEFEHRFFNDQVLLLDYMFVHRLSGMEGKDGNALNEVRVVANSLLLNGGRLQVEKLPGWPMSAPSGVRLPPEASVLGLKPGDEIRVSRPDFARLAKAFFAELEKRFG